MNIKKKLSLQSIFSIRTCPPSQLLDNPDSETKHHISICPRCKSYVDMPKEEKEAWAVLGSKLASLIPNPIQKQMPESGQIWTLQQSIGGWDGNFYRNPPMVIVLEREGNAVKVSQVCSDIEFANDGDIVFDNGFAQAWNIYTLHVDVFDICVKTVSTDKVIEILERFEGEFKSTPEFSDLGFFRKTEMETGSWFSIPCVYKLKKEFEDNL